ncbi:unnamed protein product [Mucor hiemalis]
MVKPIVPRKPTVPAKFIGHQIPQGTRYICDGVLVAPAEEWTNDAALATSVEEYHLQAKNSGDIFHILLQNLAALGGNSFPAYKSLKRYASLCYSFASQKEFKEEYIALLNARRISLDRGM